MLEITDVSAAYNGIKALHGVSISVKDGEMVALIGANGAGKSTLLNCVSGIVKPLSGTVSLDGHDITAVSPWTISQGGLLQVPEGRQILPELTVLENLQLGATALSGRAPTYALAQVLDMFPVLGERRGQRAGSLSGGEQQMLAIGRALMGAPRVLLLDEPSLGLAPLLVKQVFDILRSLKASGLTMLLVEQNARQALNVTDRAYILEQGRVVHQGESRALAEDPAVLAHYLGLGAQSA